MKKLSVVITILIILVLAASAYFYRQGNKIRQNQEVQQSKTTTPSVLPEINPISNPAEDKLPEINPLERANPFKNVYKNPFE